MKGILEMKNNNETSLCESFHVVGQPQKIKPRKFLSSLYFWNSDSRNYKRSQEETKIIFQGTKMKKKMKTITTKNYLFLNFILSYFLRDFCVLRGVLFLGICPQGQGG